MSCGSVTALAHYDIFWLTVRGVGEVTSLPARCWSIGGKGCETALHAHERTKTKQRQQLAASWQA